MSYIEIDGPCDCYNHKPKDYCAAHKRINELTLELRKAQKANAEVAKVNIDLLNALIQMRDYVQRQVFKHNQPEMVDLLEKLIYTFMPKKRKGRKP